MKEGVCGCVWVCVCVCVFDERGWVWACVCALSNHIIVSESSYKQYRELFL